MMNDLLINLGEVLPRGHQPSSVFTKADRMDGISTASRIALGDFDKGTDPSAMMEGLSHAS